MEREEEHGDIEGERERGKEGRRECGRWMHGEGERKKEKGNR